MTEPTEYGKELRRRRVACGLTHEDLASLAGVARSTIRNIETGRVQVARVRDRVETALREFESGPGKTAVSGPALMYRDSLGRTHEVDAEEFDPASLPPRDRAIYRALLLLATAALPEAGGSR